MKDVRSDEKGVRKSQFGNHNTKGIMIIDGICIIPTSPKIVYNDLHNRCVTDYCL